MFTFGDFRELLHAAPFVPFRLHLSDGGSVEIRHRELVTAGRRYAVVGLPDPADPEAPFDRHIVVWYMHVTRAETLGAGPPPMPTSGPPDSSHPSPIRN